MNKKLKNEKNMNNKYINKIMTLGIILMLAFPTALADNVVNDVAANPGSDTFTAGESTTVGYKIVGTGGDGQSGCNAADSSAATVTINTPAGVTATPGSLTFTTCNDFKIIIIIYTWQL